MMSAPRLLPTWIPDLQADEVASFLQQRRQAAFVGAWTRGEHTRWTVELQNHGGAGEGLVVDLLGPAFKKPALEILRAEAFFAGEEQIYLARRAKLKQGQRFVFDELPLTPPARKKRGARQPRPRTAAEKLEGMVERQVRAALGGAGPFLRFDCQALVSPPRRALAFTLTATPPSAPDGGFALSAWFGHAELTFQEFF